MNKQNKVIVPKLPFGNKKKKLFTNISFIKTG